MKKIFLVIITIAASLNFINAQQMEKIPVGILPTSYADGNSYKETVMVSEELANAFLKTNRFNIVDRSKIEALRRERELQKTEDFMDGSVIEQSKGIGAKYLVSSVISDYTNDGDSCRFLLSLKVIDVETGEIVASDKLVPKSGGFGKALLSGTVNVLLETEGSLTTKEKAFKNALDKMSPQIEEFVNKNFPIEFFIVEQQEKGKLLISGGSSSGVKKGTILKVYEESMINVNGKELKRKKDIAELKVEKVEDENFSTCTIKSGEKDLREKINTNANIKITFK